VRLCAACSAPRRTRQVRAFAPWPGTHADFVLEQQPGGGGGERVQIKILSTRVAGSGDVPADAAAAGRVVWGPGGRMLVPCGGGGALEVLQLQQPAKKAVAARDFANGLKGRAVFIAAPAAGAPAAADAPARR
jgi:methionyl-tRNA formyltransferase